MKSYDFFAPPGRLGVLGPGREVDQSDVFLTDQLIALDVAGGYHHGLSPVSPGQQLKAQPGRQERGCQSQ